MYLPVLNLFLNVVFSLKKVFVLWLYYFPSQVTRTWGSCVKVQKWSQLLRSCQLPTCATPQDSCSCERGGWEGAPPECPPASEFPYSLTASSYVSMPVSLAFRDISLNNTVRQFKRTVSIQTGKKFLVF
jgi:hypothetical protein